MQAGRKKNWRQGGICRKEESRTADREEYAGRKKGVQQIGRNMQAGGMKARRQGRIYRKEERRPRDRKTAKKTRPKE